MREPFFRKKVRKKVAYWYWVEYQGNRQIQIYLGNKKAVRHKLGIVLPKFMGLNGQEDALIKSKNKPGVRLINIKRTHKESE